MAQPTEASPLLGGDDHQPQHGGILPKAHRKRTIINLLFLGSFLAAASGGFSSIPQARLIEDALCHRYYEQHGGIAAAPAASPTQPIGEDQCKMEAVQSELAFVIAIQSALDAVVSFLAAFPWSLAADRVGRKPILVLALCGMELANIWTLVALWFRAVFPVRLIWFESLGLLLGGGNPVAIGLLLSILADATNDEERAVVYMRLHVASIAGNLLAPTASSFLMARTGPWPPTIIGASLLALAMLVVAFVPETLPRHTHKTLDPEQQPDTSLPLLARFQESVSMIRSPSLVLLLLACLGTMPLTLSTMSFMAVYLSKRYGLRMYQSGYVQTAFGFAQMAVSLLILPWLAHYVLQPTTPASLRQPDERRRDLVLMRWSAVIGLVAVLGLGLAPTPGGFMVGLALLALGAGSSSIMRSVMSWYVAPEQRSRLYGLVAMVEMVGAIYAQPMLAWLFALGMRLGGGEWTGLPYLGLTALMAVVAGLLWFVRLP